MKVLAITHNAATGETVEEWVDLPVLSEAEGMALDAAQHKADMRAERNARLAVCDWTTLPDVTLANRAAWEAYRQALRDVTGQAGFPDAIDWPAAP